MGTIDKFENEAVKIIAAPDETGQWEGEYTALEKVGTTFVNGSDGKCTGIYNAW